MPFLLIECDEEYARNAEANESIYVMGHYTSVKLMQTEHPENNYAGYKAWFNRGEDSEGEGGWAEEVDLS